jgi:hypothetical protein
MDGTTKPSAADRRSAHRRVGAATVVAFLALLLLGATRGPAQAESTVPAPAATSTAEPAQPAQPAPAEPQPAMPGDPGPGFDHDGDGPRGFGGGPPGGGDADPGGDAAPGGGAAPAPSGGQTQT